MIPKFKSLCRIALCAAGTGFFTPSFAGGDQVGYVTDIQVKTDGRVLVFVSGTATGKPACAHPTILYWAIADENSQAGKMMFAILMEAHATGKQVHVYGTNGCTRWVDAEDVYAINLTNN